MITKPALAPGKTVLDPDGDGYVSLKTNGVQLGYTNPPNNDVLQSEIPFIDLDKADPVADLLRGPTGAFSEIIGIDVAGNNAIMWYSDGVNLMYRFRIDYFAPNSKSYSILIDTDSKFGFTGTGADPNAMTGNPGFEVEIVLETNFNVQAYNIDGTTSGTLVASYSYDTNAQKSIAITYTTGNQDYFYDFYLPYSSISGLFTPSTALRSLTLTSMNPQPAMGNNAQSDVGGTGETGSLDAMFLTHILGETPTLPGNSVLPRSTCPTINAVGTSSTAISGTSTEASGTSITVYVYQSDGVTLIGSGTTTTSGSTWSINVSSLSPSVTLANGQIVKATATAVGKGTSASDCNPVTVTGCAGATSTSGVTLTKISGGKGYTISNSFAAGTIFTWYNADYTIATYPDKNGSLVNIVNPQTSTLASQTMNFSTQTGQTFPAGVYYFTFQEPGKCVSSYLTDCQYSTAGSSNVPTITTSSITPSTTSVSGTCVSSTGTLINLYADGVFMKSTNVISSTTWTITGLNLTTLSCASITATETDPGKCPTPTATGVSVTHPGTKPTFSTVGCSPTSPVTSVSGYSNDADGSTITLYRTSPSPRTALGTATVTSGAWTVSGLSLVSGNVVVAAITAGSCVTTGPDSDALTISTQTSLAAYVIGITAPTEGQSSVSGTISGGAYPVTLKLFIDQSQIGAAAGITVSSAGAWSVGSLLSTDLYIGGTLNITLTAASSCESALSVASAIVLCLQPAAPAYTGGSFGYCVGGAGSISLTTSESLVIYQLVDGTGTAVGPAYVGTGAAITLSTNALNTNLGPVYVKAFKLASPSCAVTSATAINFDTPSPAPTVTFTSTAVSVLRGTTSVNLPFSAKSATAVGPPATVSADTYTIAYTILAKNQGFLDVTTPTAIPSAPGNIALVVPGSAATGTYTGTLAIASGAGACSTYYSFTVTVYSASSPPVISVQPVNASICSGSTASLSVTAVNATGYQWQASTTAYNGPFSNIVGATSSSYTTTALSLKTYYRCVVSNASGSTTSDAASVFVMAAPTLGAITGTSPVCAGQSLVPYSVSAVADVTAYNWSYTGTATINGSGNAVTLSFPSNATSGTLSVTGTNTCGTGAAQTYAITVGATPFINNMAANACTGSAFSVTPVNVTNGIVPSGTTYSWSAPVVTGSMTGGATGSGASSITGTLANPTSTTQTATYTVTPVKGSCTGATFTLTVSVNSSINLTATPVNASCNGGTTGGVNLSVSGGTPTYTYAWTGPSSFTATTQNLTGRGAGIYSVTVTDSRGCTATASATVTEPIGISIAPSITNILCNGSSTGAISISVSGGTSPYTYLWNDGNASQNRTLLPAGTYSVTVTDANGCTQASSSIIVSQPSVLSATVNKTNISCNGSSDGAITITSPTGGNGTYQYRLDSGTWQSSGSFTGLAPNIYSVQIRDAANTGCTIVLGNQTISQPDALTGTVSKTNVTCNSSGDGTITVSSPAGGYGTYEYRLDTGTWQSSGTLSGLVPATYSVQIRDAAHPTCAVTLSSQAITQPSALTATVAKTNVSCNGSNDGIITVSSPSGGYGTYQYRLDTGSWQSGGTFTGLAPATYSVQIRDAANTACVVTLGSQIISQQSVLSATVAHNDITCYGSNNGTISISSPTGGYGTYEYQLDNGNWQSSGSFTGLSPVTYAVKIRDAAHTSCVVSLTSQTLGQPTALSLSASTTNVLCNGGNTGAISLTTPSTGTSPYTYAWTASGGGVIPSGQATNQSLTLLVAGTYLVTATDGNGCIATASYPVTQSSAFSVSTVLIQPTCPPTATINNSDGRITVNVTGGSSSYTYSKDGTTFQVSNVFTSLQAGSYTITIKDSNNCTTTTAVTLNYLNPKPVTPGTIIK
jgi:hypothetical protein